MKNKLPSWHSFWRGIFIYAIVLAFLGAGFLWCFWNYLAAFESSRPETVIGAYLENMTDEHIWEISQNSLPQIDYSIQPEEECRSIICNAVSGNISYARNVRESSKTKQVYSLRAGEMLIGHAVLTAQPENRYGFTPWQISEEQFDFSWMIKDSIEKIVPSDYRVSVNGHILESEYITDSAVHYPELEEYYSEYDLPHCVKYEAGPFLGNVEVEVFNQQGELTQFDENTDRTQFFDNCTEEQRKQLVPFVETFIERYAVFSSSTRENCNTNYAKLVTYIQFPSDLLTRLAWAKEGLQYGQSAQDKVVQITPHYMTQLADDTYLCDVTWEVDTTGKKGVVKTETSSCLVIVQTENGLKVREMSNY